MTEILRLDHVKVHFGGVRAVDDISLSLQAGRLYGLVGPNGSGKTTTVNAVCGQYRLTSGSVYLEDRRISGMPSSSIYTSGLARTFQGLRLLPRMTVLENVLCGAETKLGRIRGRKAAAAATDAAIERLNLGQYRTSRTGALPYGTQRRVEIARALAGSPRFLLLDEPVAGMNQGERREIANVLQELRKDGLTMLLIEHDMKFVLKLTDELIVMNFGQILAKGDPAQTATLPAVQEAYLGSRRARA